LWDIESGNIVGEFPSADAALEVVQSLLDAFGAAYADTLALQPRAGNGSAGTATLGQDLVQLIADRAERPAGLPTGT
jgi:hypothetical protein